MAEQEADRAVGRHPWGWIVVALVASGLMLALLVGSVGLFVAKSTSQAMAVAARAVPQVPAALGFPSPRRYLLAVLNPAELRSSGGAPLSVALVTVDHGRVQVEEQGQTSTEIIPGNPKVTWKHVTQKPFPSGEQASRFVNATEHPDFRLAGEELMRAWAASGKPVVDGVVAIDTSAIIDALRETGPVITTKLGEVSADNFKDKWIASYRTLSSVTGERQSANDEIAAVLIERSRSFDGLTGILRVLTQAAPGRHLQVRLEDVRLQQAAQEAGVGGLVSTPTDDHSAWYSVNNNASKTDVFGERTLTIDATLSADGGAHVTQTMTVTNAVPDEVFGDGSKAGYGTVWNASRWTAYVPDAAVAAAMAVPPKWKPATQWSDGLGRTVFVTNGWLARGKQATIVLSYDLLAGTFPDGIYRLTVDPQPLLTPAALTVAVTHPDGRQETLLNGVPLDRTIEVESGP